MPALKQVQVQVQIVPRECVEHTYYIACLGRGFDGREILQRPVKVDVTVRQYRGSNTLSSTVKCQYNTGGHGQRCKAAHPEADKVGEGITCPYSFDIPYALERIANPTASQP